MKKILDHLDELIAAIVLVILVVVMFLNVLFRQIEGVQFSAFADELTTKLFVLFSLLGASAAIRRGSHLGLSILTDAMNVKVRKWIHLAGYLIGAAFCVILVVYGIKMTVNEYRMGQTTLTNQWPEWIFGIYVPIGGAFCLFRFLQQAVLELKGRDEA